MNGALRDVPMYLLVGGFAIFGKQNWVALARRGKQLLLASGGLQLLIFLFAPKHLGIPVAVGSVLLLLATTIGLRSRGDLPC